MPLDADLLSRTHEMVQGALPSRRAGTVCAVRLSSFATEDHGRLEHVLARALALTQQWIGAAVSRVYAVGGAASGQIVAHLAFEGGQMALVTVGLRGQTPPRIDLLVVGNQGVLVHGGDDHAALGPPSTPDDAPDAQAVALLAAVRASLAEGRAVEPGGRAAESKGAPRALPAARQPPTVASDRPAAGAVARLQPPLGVLLVAGAATHQESYAAAFAADARCRLIGVSDAADVSARRQALNRRLAEQLGIPLLADLDQALRREDVHLVSICAEPERRAEIAIRCAQAGKHLYLDKPLAATVLEADAICAAVRKAGVASQMFSLVHAAPAARLRRLFDSRSLGQIQGMHCDLLFAKGVAGTARLRQPRKEAVQPTAFETIQAKREMHNVGVYPLVMAGWLLGQPVRRVYATTGNYFFREHQQHDMEDFGQITAELAGGAVLTVCVGRTGWKSHPASGVQQTSLLGDRGVAVVDAFRPRLEVYSDEAAWEPPPTVADDPMAFWAGTMAGQRAKRAWLTADLADNDARHFIDCLVAGRASDVPAELAAAALEVLLAAYQSAASGQPVALPLQRS